MRKIRILVVDDSVVVRRALCRELSKDPAVEVVGTAPNGRVALAKVALTTPDLVTLDVEMPEMNGLEMLAALRKTHPLLPVVMFSVFTKPGSAITLDALAFPAVDYVTKPSFGAHTDVALKVINEDLLPKIKMLCSGAAGVGPSAASSPGLSPSAAKFPGQTSPPRAHPSHRVDLVVIGVSTGGPDALGELLPHFPEDFPVPILIVQHMPPVFTGLLAERLAAKSKIRVAEAGSHQLLKPGHAWLAPGDLHMVVEKTAGEVRVRTYQGPPEHSCRPSVDVLFRSAAEAFGSHVLAVVMTGMGQDGLLGCEQIRRAGGQILLQDEASCIVWGMPRLVAEAGLGHQVLPLGQLGTEILRRVLESRKSTIPTDARMASE